MAKLPKFREEFPCLACPLGEQGCAKIKASGSRRAKILVVTHGPHDGNAAHYKEHMTRDALAVFKRAMHENGFTDSDFVFVSSVRCYYDRDLRPTKEKTHIAEQCREYLLRTIDQMKPDIIVPLGVEAARSVYGKAKKITKIRGAVEWDADYNAHIFPMIDPQMVSNYPQNWGTFKADARSLRRLMDNGFNEADVARQGLGEYEIVDDLQFLIDKNPEVLVLDTETEGKRWSERDKRLLTIQLTDEAGKGYMVVWDHPEAPANRQTKRRLRRQFKELLEREELTVVGQNLKYDALWMYTRVGVRFRIGDDTLMLAAILDENNLNKDLSSLTKMFVPEMAGYDDLFNRTYDKSRMQDVPIAEILNYGCGDSDACKRLHEYFWGQIETDPQLVTHYDEVSLPGLNAFVSTEMRGLKVNLAGLDDLRTTLAEYVDELEESLLTQIPRRIKRDHLEAGKEIKLSRPDLLRDILFHHPAGFNLRPRVFTKTTAKLAPELQVPSTSSKDHLPFFFDDCPFTEELAEYQKLSRLLGTNIEKFQENYMIGDMVYPSYQLHVTVTGRTSCLREDQLVDTRHGKKRADNIEVGDEVFTHMGRFRPVTKLFRKPVTPMVDVRFSNGEVLHVTLDHIVLLNSGEFVTVRSIIQQGIDYAQCQQEAYAGRRASFAGSRNIPHIYDDCAGSSGQVSCEPRNSASHDSEAHIRRGLQEVRALQISRQQAGEKEPSVWQSAGIRLRGWQGLPYETSRGQEILCASDSIRGGYGHEASRIARVDDCTSHRREPEEQQSRQPCTDNAEGVFGYTRPIPVSFRRVSIESIDYSGSYRVYDFEVEEDHSYLAGGVFSHNSQDPNGQNFPKRGRFAKAYRKLFVPNEGYFMLEADLSQAELRISADMSNDQEMIRIYNSPGGDIHKTTALIVTGLSAEQFAQLDRTEQSLARFKAKAVNFGFIYGMGWRKFITYAKTQYGVEFTDREAQRIRDQFFQRYPALVRWHKAMREYARTHGYVRSYSGRVRHLPMIYSREEYIRNEAERQAINSPVQEFASSIGVMALSNIDQDVNPDYLAITGFVHDAIYALVPYQYAEWGAKTLKHYMETVDIEGIFNRRLKVPILADVSIGLNGGEQFEMAGLDLDTEYNWESQLEYEPEDGFPFEMTEQLTPPDDGLIELPRHLVRPSLLAP